MVSGIAVGGDGDNVLEPMMEVECVPEDSATENKELVAVETELRVESWRAMDSAIGRNTGYQSGRTLEISKQKVGKMQSPRRELEKGRANWLSILQMAIRAGINFEASGTFLAIIMEGAEWVSVH
jgi:hypothetical protein